MRGVRFEQAGDYASALTQFQQSLRAEPRYFYAYRQIGVCEQMLGNSALAVDALDRYLRFRPDDRAALALERGLRRLTVPGPGAGEASDRGLPLGVCLFGGYGFAAAASGGGLDVNNDAGYLENPGAGFDYGGDLTWNFLPHLQAGLGLRSITMSRTGSDASSTSDSWQDGTDTYRTGFNALAALAEVQFRLPLASRWDLVGGVGLGLVPGYALHYSETVVNGPNTLEYDDGPTLQEPNQTTSMKGTYTTSLGVAYDGTLGVEYRLTRSFSLLLDVDVLCAVNPSLGRTESWTVTQNGTGALVSQIDIHSVYSNNPPADTHESSVMSSSSSGEISTTTTSYDWGSGKEVVVETYNGATGRTSTKVTETLYTTWGAYTLLRLSPMLGVAYRF
jgi:hypothetical protein